MPELSSSARVLLFVDDEPINHEIFSYQFSDKWHIFFATSGDEALEIFKNHPEIGIIVSDLKMPGISGIEFLTRIFTINPDTIRIIVTGHARFQSVLDAINKGHIYQYVLKPWDPVNLGIILEQGFRNWNLIRENRILVEQQQETNKQLQTLSQKLLHVQEIERKRISMDLHDGIGQNLIALKLQLRSLSSILEGKINDHDTFETIATIGETIQQTIDDTRNLSHNLSPALIEEFGFDSALDEFLGSFERYYMIQTEGIRVKLEPLFSQNIQQQLYRIIQEIFNNIGKHSGSKRVSLDMRVDATTLTVDITDYGCGFTVRNTPGGDYCTHGLGLTTIKERATLLGGSVHILSTLNQGTKFTVTIPFSIPTGDTNQKPLAGKLNVDL